MPRNFENYSHFNKLAIDVTVVVNFFHTTILPGFIWNDTNLFNREIAAIIFSKNKNQRTKIDHCTE